jgi:hypothetical protein
VRTTGAPRSPLLATARSSLVSGSETGVSARDQPQQAPVQEEAEGGGHPQTLGGMVLANLDKLSVEFELMEHWRITEPARIVQRAADPSAVTPHVLVGAGVQFNDEWGRAHDYAAIVAVIPSNNAVGDLVLLQYFERRRGEPSTQRLIPLVELSGSDRWVLYKSVAEMIWAHAQEEGRKAETLARLNGTLPPEKPGEDDRFKTPLAKLVGGLLPSGVRQ